MNGMNIISIALIGYLKWLVFFSVFSLLSACGGGSDEDDLDPRAIDTEAPVIIINGEATISLIQGEEYTDLGASAQDQVDGEVTITINGSVDASILGTYVITYTATDIAGNQATAIRTINVREYLAFITTWKTDNSGKSNDNQIEILTDGSANFSVDWGDGNIEENLTATVTHTYGAAGTYTVSISGDFPRIYFPNFTSIESDCDKLLSIEQWGDVKWTSMELAFANAQFMVMNATDTPDLSGVTSLNGMFYETGAFNGDLSNWDVSNVTDMTNMFYDADAFNGDISNWNVSSVTSMFGMFTFADAFNGDISNWDVSSVTSMYNMFNFAYAFNGDISNWDVSSVTNMDGMFSYTRDFNGDISNWDVSRVTSMYGMFSSAASFNGDISTWDVSSVTDMGCMFCHSKLFNGDISNWDVSSVTNMFGVFNYAAAFNGDISNWDVSKVTSMYYMLSYAVAFNGDISKWNVSRVKSMKGMFYGASAFDGDLSGWDVSSVTTMSFMFTDSALTYENYDAILLGWSALSGLQNDVFLGVNGIQYSSGAESARNVLVNTYGWTVTDGGLAID